jgi:ketosteroid isomerase-like protein
MSQSDVDLAKRLYELFAKGDIPGVLGLFDPQIEWFEAEGNPYQPDGSAWIGPEAVLQKLFVRIGQEWDGFAVTPRAYTAIDGGVLMEGRYSGTYKATGRSMNLQVAHVLEMRDNRITKFQQYVDTAALQATMIAAMESTSAEGVRGG